MFKPCRPNVDIWKTDYPLLSNYLKPFSQTWELLNIRKFCTIFLVIWMQMDAAQNICEISEWEDPIKIKALKNILPAYFHKIKWN